MRKNFSFIILAVSLLFSANAFAQKTYKLGHIDSNELLSMMPEQNKVKADIEAFAKQLEDQLGTMQGEFESKYQKYMEEQEQLSPLIRQTREQELGEMQQRIQMFQQNAQQELQGKQGELFQPIIDKAQAAIKSVATENGFTYIFDISAGAVVHYSDDSENILPLVKAKLGIQ